MITATEFSERLSAAYPQLHAEIVEDAGLPHLHMAAFARLTQAAIEVGRLDTVREHFMFADGLFRDAAPDLQNAFYVSYLEHLEFIGRHGRDAQSLMPPALHQGWRDITDYNGRLADASRGRDHGTRNA